MWNSSNSKLIPIPLECKKLIILNALFQGGRLFVGAVCVLYFLSFGKRTEDYAWIKTAQAIIFIGLDIPLGYLLNRIGEYRSLLLSLVFGAIGAFGYLTVTSFFGFLISEIFLALSISIWPIALSAYSMRVLENYKIEGLVEKYFHLGDAISNIFVVLCGSLGGVLYAFNRHIPYGCFLIIYLLSALFAWSHLKDFAVGRPDRKEDIKFLLLNFKKMSSILPFALILFLIQFLMQPLFHYWQPLFREKFALGSKDMSFVFIGYSLAMSTISWSYSRMTYMVSVRSNLFIAIAALTSGLAYICISKMNVFVSSVIFLALTFGFFNLVQIACGVLIQNRLKNEDRMLVTKYISFCSRIGMVISLVTLHLLFSKQWSTSEVYKLYGVLTTLGFCCYLVSLVMQKKRKEKKYVHESTS